MDHSNRVRKRSLRDLVQDVDVYASSWFLECLLERTIRMLHAKNESNEEEGEYSKNEL